MAEKQPQKRPPPMTSLDIVKAVLALLFVLGLIGGLAWGLRRAGALPGLARARAGGKNRRLELSETLPLDGRYRLVLIRRDTREHLLLLGPNESFVVETVGESAERSGVRREPAE